jgi:hypothetical protein
MGALSWEDFYQHEAPRYSKNAPVAQPEPNGGFEYPLPVEEKKP